MLVAMLAIVALGLAPGGQGSCNVSSCAGPVGPGGEAVTDSFYFVHQPLDANGGITVRMTSLAGEIPVTSGNGMRSGLVPWAKAGIIIKASTRQGSAYAAMMITAASPCWLRLTRSGDTIAGYYSPDGTRWTRVGLITLTGLPAVVPSGLFATSPQYSQTSLSLASVNGGPSQATGVFDHLSLRGSWPDGAWTGSAIGAPGGPAGGSPGGFLEAAGRFTVTGTGDIAPSVSGASGIGVTIAQTLIGVFAGLIVVVVVGAMFMTAEYRRGLIRVTLAATPRRGRVLAAKAVVIGAVTFAAGLVSAAVVVTLGQRVLRGNGVYVWPVTALTEVRVIVGTAAVLAVASVLALAVGTVLRHSAAAVAAVIVVIVLPYLLTVAVPILPLGPTDWLARVTPAAGFAVQQTVIQYPQVDNIYAPSAGYYPLAPWAGFAVLCAWAVLALALANYVLSRRDA
jgi:ABC-type transport system involved in multi-copper enzyme maturation permease subunit